MSVDKTISAVDTLGWRTNGKLEGGKRERERESYYGRHRVDSLGLIEDRVWWQCPWV